MRPAARGANADVFLVICGLAMAGGPGWVFRLQCPGGLSENPSGRAVPLRWGCRKRAWMSRYLKARARKASAGAAAPAGDCAALYMHRRCDDAQRRGAGAFAGGVHSAGAHVRNPPHVTLLRNCQHQPFLVMTEVSHLTLEHMCGCYAHGHGAGTFTSHDTSRFWIEKARRKRQNKCAV